MDVYLDALRYVFEKGKKRPDRTAVGVYSVFGYQMRFCNIGDTFPLLTTKEVNFHAIVEELLWFIRGETNVRSLQAKGVKIWDEWADDEGNLGPIYGAQWRNWEGEKQTSFDQLNWVINEIIKNPYSRRLLVSTWNVAQLENMKLMPCHVLFQFYVHDKHLNCHLYQRSGDIFLGVPFNIASYSLLTLMVAQVTGLQAGEFIHTIGDLHLYCNHVQQAQVQLQRQPKTLPQVTLNLGIKNIDDFTSSDITLRGYQHYPKIFAPVAV